MRALCPWLGLLGTLALAGLPAPAGAQALGSEFQVNTYTTGNQQTADYSVGRLIATDASGNFVVVWESDDQDGNDFGIFGQRYDSAGAALGSEFRVSSFTTSSQSRPSVASDASGNFVVVWESFGQDGDEEGIFGQRYDSAGGTLGREFRVSSFTFNEQEDSSVAADPSGNFVVVWSSYQTEHYSEIYGQRYDSAGKTLGGEFRVNSYTTHFQYNPSVASDPSGNFVVVWASSPGYNAGTRGVFGQRYDSDGVRQGDEFRVSSISGPPSVASDASGNFVVVWHRSGSYSSDEIYGRRYDSGGVPQGPQFHVNSFTAGYQHHPSVASDASGNFLVAWASADQDGNDYGIFGQRYDSAGVAQGDEFQINSYTTSAQYSPSVGATGTDQFVVAWTSDSQDGDDKGVFGRRLVFGAGSITVVSPNTNVKWRIGSLHCFHWAHNLGPSASFRIELDRDDDGDYEELVAAHAPATSATRGGFDWTVTGPPSGTARVRISWSDDLAVSDASDATFQIRPAP